MIYVEALVSDQVLIAKGECGGYANTNYGSGDDFRRSDPTLALLRASKQIHNEAIPVFFAVNTFKLSPQRGLGKFSVFTKHAALFRNVAVEFDTEHCYKYRADKAFDLAMHKHVIYTWRDQIRGLASLFNLRFLELNVRNLVAEAYSGKTTFGELIMELKPQLLASVPFGVRQKRGVRSRGVWVTISAKGSYFEQLDIFEKTWMEMSLQSICSGDSEKIHEIGEGWRELGINFQPRGSLHPPPRSGSSIKWSPSYYG